MPQSENLISDISIYPQNSEKLALLDLCGIVASMLVPHVMMFSKYWHNELMLSRSCHGVRGKCTGHGEKYGDHWKERKTWHFNYTPLILGKLYRNGREHGKLSQPDFSIKFQRLAENCIFFELSERRVHFAPECFETELHSQCWHQSDGFLCFRYRERKGRVTRNHIFRRVLDTTSRYQEQPAWILCHLR